MCNKYLTIIVPTYQGASTIKRALDSISMEPLFKDICDVYILDDGSTDETLKIVESHEIDATVFRKGGDPKGAVYSRNIMAKHVRTPFVMNLDQDDCIASEWAQFLPGVLMNSNQDIILYGDLKLSRRSLKRYVKTRINLNKNIKLNSWRVAINTPPRLGTIVFPRKILSNNASFGDASDGGDEWVLIYRLIESGYLFQRYRIPALVRYEHEQNESRKNYCARQRILFKKAKAEIDNDIKFFIFTIFYSSRIARSVLKEKISNYLVMKSR